MAQQIDSLQMPPPVSHPTPMQPIKLTKNAVKRKLQSEAKAGPQAKAKQPRRTVSHCLNFIAVRSDSRLASPAVLMHTCDRVSTWTYALAAVMPV